MIVSREQLFDPQDLNRKTNGNSRRIGFSVIKCDRVRSFSIGITKSSITLSLFTALVSASTNAGIERDQAKLIHDRLAGVPPSESVLDAMEADIVGDSINGPITAAHRAMENPAFYNVTLKNIAAPWTNRDQNVFVPLNDYIATYIGLVRDGEDFRKILYDNIFVCGKCWASLFQ